MSYYSDSSDDEFRFEETALRNLRKGHLAVRNDDGTLRCPLSPFRTKQSYQYRDLLQHADGAAKGKRGRESAGKHRALFTYLTVDLANLATSPVEQAPNLIHATPQRGHTEELLVFPWCGLIYNIDISSVSRDGTRAGVGIPALKNHFKVFNPEKVHVFWGREGHMGMAVIHFRSGMDGLADALAYEKWNVDEEHGRKDWERRRRVGLGTELYGWLARKEDYQGRRELKDDHHVSRYLKEIGDLKDVEMAGQDLAKVKDRQIATLQDSYKLMQDNVETLRTETEIVRKNAERQKEELERKHKEELEQIRIKGMQSCEEHAKIQEQNNQRVQETMDELNKRLKELLEKTDKDQNQADTSSIEKLKSKLDLVNQQKDLQKKYQADQVELMRKHEEEDKRLAEWTQNRLLGLAERQERELKVLRLGEKIETEKFEIEMSNPEEKLEQNLERIMRQKAELQTQVEALAEEIDASIDTISVLTNQQRTANDELEEARKVSLEVVKKHGNATLCVKRMGQIEEEPWKRPCQEKFKNSKVGWEVKFTKKLSHWENRLKNPEFCPFKIIKVGCNKFEQQLDKDNPELIALKTELGEEVWQTVVTALLEIEKYNASGRYPVPIAWNSGKNQRATLKEVIDRLLEKLATLQPKKRGVKRPAGNRG